MSEQSKAEHASVLGLICGGLVFIWILPALLVVGALQRKKAEQIGFAARDLISAITRG